MWSFLKETTSIHLVISLTFFILVSGIGTLSFPLLIWADEGSEGSEYEGDEESESSEYSDNDTSSATETVTRTYTVMQQVEEVVWITPPVYQSDQDADELVDALDPNPTTHQREFFTDDDGDSIANAYDQYPGLDDLVTFSDETDENKNGLIDRYET